MDVPASAKHLAECNDVANLWYGTWHWAQWTHRISNINNQYYFKPMHANFFCRESECKYFRLCGSYGFCPNYLVLSYNAQAAQAAQYVGKWT